MHENPEILIQRVKRTLEERLVPAIYSPISPLRVSAWRVPREGDVIGEPVSFADIPDTFPNSQWGNPGEVLGKPLGSNFRARFRLSIP